MSEDRPVSSTRGFRVHFYEQEGALIAECHGRLIYENAPHLKDEVRAKIPGNKHIILDLLDVPQVDSSGLGTVVGLYVSGRTRGCSVELANASQQIRELLSMTNLLSLFEAAGRHHGKTI